MLRFYSLNINLILTPIKQELFQYKNKLKIYSKMFLLDLNNMQIKRVFKTFNLKTTDKLKCLFMFLKLNSVI